MISPPRPPETSSNPIIASVAVTILARFFIGWIDKLIERAEASERFATEGQRRETVTLFRKAQEYYVARAGE